MPRWASRITLEITELRVQRLQEISWIDIRAESVSCPEHDFHSGFCASECSSLRSAFVALWDSINGKPRAMLDDDGNPVLDDNERPIMHPPKSWASNPWVWAISFAMVR